MNRRQPVDLRPSLTAEAGGCMKSGCLLTLTLGTAFVVAGIFIVPKGIKEMHPDSPEYRALHKKEADRLRLGQYGIIERLAAMMSSGNDGWDERHFQDEMRAGYGRSATPAELEEMHKNHGYNQEITGR